MVASATLLFASSLNFCHLSSGPVFVARSGKNTDFLCKKDMPLCRGFVPCGVDCVGALADGASGTEPDWFCCATPTEQTKHKMIAIGIRCRMAAFRA